LRHDWLDAPWVIDGPINRELLDLHIETQLAPTLHKGDVVILDTLATHRSPKAAAILKDIGARVLPATLQSRPQSHRDGICQAQSPDPHGRCPNL
jgi:hypothetical protein